MSDVRSATQGILTQYHLREELGLKRNPKQGQQVLIAHFSYAVTEREQNWQNISE